MNVRSFCFAHKTSFIDVRSLSQLLKLPTGKETCQHWVQVWFSVENSHVFLCQNVSNLVQSSLVFETVYCLPASPPFIARVANRERTAICRHMITFFGCFILGLGVLACWGKAGAEMGRRRSCGSFPSPTPASQDLARRLIIFTVANRFIFSIITPLFVCLKTCVFFSQRTISIWSTSPQRKIYKERKITKKTPAHKRGQKGISAHQITAGIKD